MTASPISFGARLRQLADARGDQTALVFLPGVGEAQTYSWRDLNAMADRFARALMARGVGQGDVVGFALGNVPAHIALAVAVWLSVLAMTLVLLTPTSPAITDDDPDDPYYRSAALQAASS